MRLLPLGLIVFLALAEPAGAEDFTGAYAGVNAGYAFSKSDRAPAGPGFLAPDGTGATEMPPSARQASETLRARNLRDRSGIPLPR